MMCTAWSPAPLPNSSTPAADATATCVRCTNNAVARCDGPDGYLIAVVTCLPGVRGEVGEDEGSLRSLPIRDKISRSRRRTRVDTYVRHMYRRREDVLYGRLPTASICLSYRQQRLTIARRSLSKPTPTNTLLAKIAEIVRCTATTVHTPIDTVAIRPANACFTHRRPFEPHQRPSVLTRVDQSPYGHQASGSSEQN